MSFGENLKRIRKTKGLTQAQLAEKSGVSYGAIVNYENGRRKEIQSATIAKLANALNVLPSDLDNRLSSLLSMYEVQHEILQDINNQTDHLAYVDMIRTEFVEDGLFNSIKDEKTAGNLYKAVAYLFALNADGQNKAIDYIMDLNKITEYRNEAAMYAVSVMTNAQRRDDLCRARTAEPQITQDQSDSAQMGDGKPV